MYRCCRTFSRLRVIIGKNDSGEIATFEGTLPNLSLNKRLQFETTVSSDLARRADRLILGIGDFNQVPNQRPTVSANQLHLSLDRKHGGARGTAAHAGPAE